MTQFFSTKTLKLLTAVTLFAVSASPAKAAEDFPTPTPQHTWLQQFVGEWKTATECIMEPGKPAVKSEGTESIKPVGGFWIVDENKGEMMGKPFMGLMTLGYDNDKKKYVGSWVDSMSGQQFTYEGTVDPSGKILTLESEGKCPMNGNKLMRFKDVLEVKSKDHKVFTSSIQDDKGQWMTMMTSHSHRTK